MSSPTLILTTAPQPGAVAILQLHGPGSRAIVQQLTRRDPFDDGRVYLASFDEIDEGLAVCRGDDWAQLMPHGGPRVVSKLTQRLIELGAAPGSAVKPRQLYPEADSDIEADMLAAIASAPSPAAIDLLAAQPRLWRQYLQSSQTQTPSLQPALDHLLTPATVVIAGVPNVGKSTLTNAILGRSVSLVADLPGTTRDWVGSLLEIGGVAVRWLDTPGLRQSDDPVEQKAIHLANRMLRDADVLVAVRDPQSKFPQLPGARQADVEVINKVDDASATEDEPLPISALHDRNLDVLQRRILQSLGLDTMEREVLWPFSPTLRGLCSGESVDLQAYTGVD